MVKPFHTQESGQVNRNAPPQEEVGTTFNPVQLDLEPSNSVVFEPQMLVPRMWNKLKPYYERANRQNLQVYTLLSLLLSMDFCLK